MSTSTRTIQDWMNWHAPESSVAQEETVQKVQKSIVSIFAPSLHRGFDPGDGLNTETGETSQVAQPYPNEERQSALRLLNEIGCRLMDIDGKRAIGVWPELDDPKFKEALRVVGMDHLPVAWLDNPAIPAKYRTCHPKVQRLREARKPVSWEEWILSRPISSLGGSS